MEEDVHTRLDALKFVRELKVGHYPITLQDAKRVHKVVQNFQILSNQFQSIIFNQVQLTTTALNYLSDAFSPCYNGDNSAKNNANNHVFMNNNNSKDPKNNNDTTDKFPKIMFNDCRWIENEVRDIPVSISSLGGSLFNEKNKIRIKLSLTISHPTTFTEVTNLLGQCQQLEYSIYDYYIAYTNIVFSYVEISDVIFRYLLILTNQRRHQLCIDDTNNNNFTTNPKIFNFYIDQCSIYEQELSDLNDMQGRNIQICWDSTNMMLEFIEKRRLGEEHCRQVTQGICAYMDKLIQDPIYRSNIISLRLTGKGISTTAIDYIILNLNKTNLKTLGFSETNISDTQITKLSSELKSKDTTIIELDHAGNNPFITLIGMQSLLDCLKSPSCSIYSAGKIKEAEIILTTTNMTMKHLKLPLPMDKTLKLSFEFYLSLNRLGRKNIFESKDEISASLLSILLAKTKNDVSVMYWIIHRFLNILLWYQRKEATLPKTCYNDGDSTIDDDDDGLLKKRRKICISDCTKT